MPSGLLPDEGIAQQLQYIISTPISGVLSWYLLLFVNDLTPAVDTVLADLTEASFGGYSRLQLDRSIWTAPTVYEGCATSTYGTNPIVYYVSDAMGQTVYGAAYIDQSTGVIRWVQRFDDADIQPLITGGQFQILPQYTLTSAACGSMSRRPKPRNKRRAKGESRA